MIRKPLPPLLLVSVSLAAILALSSVSAMPAAGNLPPEQRSRVDAVFSAWNHSDSPGCALAVISKGRIVYERGYGMANLDHGVAIGPETVFYVGSVSKQFTAASVALMAAQGILDLDADIRRYVPEMPAYGQPVTVRHLVHHTSGVRDIYTLMNLAGKRIEDVFPDRQALQLIARQRELNFDPGSEFLYSNSGYFLLSEIVERLSNSSLREYAEQNIFRPLDMRDTHFHDSPGHILPRRATSYESDGKGSFRVSYLSNFDKVGAGGLYSTVRDLYKWDQNFYHGRVGGKSFLEQIQTPGRLSDGSSLSYAFGLRIGPYRGLPTVSHGGSMMGFKADYVQFPEQEFSVFCLCNLGSINPGALTRAVADIYLEGQFPEALPVETPRAASRRGEESATASLNASQMDGLVGEYFSPELDRAFQIVRDGDSLAAIEPDGDRVPLVATAPDTLRLGAFTLRVIREAGGSVQEIRLDAGRARNFLFLPR